MVAKGVPIGSRGRALVRLSRRAFAAEMAAAVGAGLAARGAGAQDATPATPTASPPLGPITYDETTLVSGTIADFVIDLGDATAATQGATHYRDGTITARLISNDPRVAGMVAGTWNADTWGPGPDNGALVQWGTSVLSNEGGTWEAAYVGVYTTATGDILSRWYVGTGTYAGLTFFMWFSGDLGTDRWMGLIYPGTPPPPI